MDGMHTKRTFGWDIYTICCQLPSCQEPGISFFDAIHKFSHNYLVIIYQFLPVQNVHPDEQSRYI